MALSTDTICKGTLFVCSLLLCSPSQTILSIVNCYDYLTIFSLLLFQLIIVNEPDLVLFVGEALVGNEAIDQLVKFNQSLADYSSTAKPHAIDGIVLTKFDTIDDKVNFPLSSALSITS